MTKQVRAEIEELLKDFGGGRKTSTQYSVPSTQRAGTEYRVASTERASIQLLVAMTQKKQGRPWSRAQRRAWREMMDEAGCRLPFPQEREDVYQILAYVLGRLVARRISPRSAEAVVQVCKLMLRT